MRNSLKSREKSLTKRVLNGFFWTFSGTGINFSFQVLVLLILARLLTPEDFGVVSAAMVVVSFAMIFSEVLIGPALVQRLEINERHIHAGFTISLIFGVTLTIIIYLNAASIASFFRIKELTSVLKVMSVIFVVKSVSVVAESLLKRELKFKELAVLQVVSYAGGYGVVGLALASMGFGVWALVGANMFQSLINSILALMIQKHPKKIQLEIKATKELLYLGGGFSLGRISNFFALQGDNLVVGRWLGAESLGLYGRVYQLMVMPANLFGQAVDKVLFPAFAKIQNKKQSFSASYFKGVSLTATITIPMSIFLIIYAPEIVLILLGENWDEVIVPFQIMAVGMYFRTAYKVSGTVLRAKGAVYQLAWRQFFYAILVFFGALLGQNYGIKGVAFALTVVLGIHFISMAQLSINITSGTWRKFLSLHISIIPISLVTALSSVIFSSLLRGIALSPIMVLCISIMLLFLVVVVFFKLAPTLLFGKDGLAIFNEVYNHFNTKIKSKWELFKC